MSTSIRALVGPKALQTPRADNNTSLFSAISKFPVCSRKNETSIGAYRDEVLSFSEKKTIKFGQNVFSKKMAMEPVPKLIDCALNAHGFGTASMIKKLTDIKKPGYYYKPGYAFEMQ
jgi:hypothetical protein